ncbi:pre-mRNA-processing factor 17, putative [Plasmodium berghei]|uniref:Pre-mRNA-processing factor 17 n=2 Tax=Plasmodium berghei TaxID=5821 RepID=A0A509AQV4_PLABA|nr:pre-mRNA-processing factor 17, putative [Plasmodium berghei ANKA]CXJ21243.1 pre-mRNA-processing factor 17, putative [Plasmodium berghei]SCM26585.1 pre-mRNA-processing factor 17, putative [Plasmodium berghei]SCN28533.1 pre-mRNA-processing factor 17, putative [Plasmodium berghei]SCO62722.1 pre-mRNA-processing factor 17, putative [Plasmodium berghei]SCO64282.1 pre-mRNA-processing factor 17, putative [Plasmodium berghei]|eukprot:XP_034424178.1 pre-mRNA-processing factor 17, putative [Plasmodium berghei ANKA]
MDLLREYDENDDLEVDNSNDKNSNEKGSSNNSDIKTTDPICDENNTSIKNEKNENTQIINISSMNLIDCAPDVNTYDMEIKNYREKFKNIEKKIMFDDPVYHSILSKPQQGPCINGDYNFLKNTNKNHFNGNIETTFVNKNMFDYQYNHFNVTGIAQNPALKNYYQNNYQNYIIAKNPISYSENNGQFHVNKNRKKRGKNESNDYYSMEKYKGPWECRESNNNQEKENRDEQTCDNKKPKNAKNDDDVDESKKNNSKKTIFLKLEPCGLEEAIQNNTISEQNTLYNDKIVSTLHINYEVDYYKKSWFELPSEYKEKDFIIEENFPPKKEIHTYKGHKMGVQKIRFFPKYGNYILSGSLDSTLKLWGSYKSKKCLRTYKGHFKGVKDVLFDKDGSNFISCSYDNNVIYWDTEYGKIKGIYSQKKTPYCLCLNNDDPNVFLVGGANNKICHIDFRTGNIELEYNEHLQAINTITLCENNKKLVSTSDDKKIFIWEYGLPVVVKYISDASMFSITSVSVHPSNKFFLCQSMNNIITVYEATGKFRFFSKKTFKGHKNIGYSINVSCSNDGKYVISGDSNGGLFIWNWKKMSNFKNMKAHSNVCIDCAWHPFKTSMLATASWDSTIKLWE